MSEFQKNMHILVLTNFQGRVKKHYFKKVAYIFFRITPWESPFRSSSICQYLLPVAWKKSPRAKALTVCQNFNKDQVVISRHLYSLSTHLDNLIKFLKRDALLGSSALRFVPHPIQLIRLDHLVKLLFQVSHIHDTARRKNKI